MTDLTSILINLPKANIIDASITPDQYVAIDLSVHNSELSKLDCTNAADFESYIEDYLRKNKAKVAIGGYNEMRNLYKRSTVFKNEETDERNIHIGIDLWIKAGTPLFAALDGIVHSFNFNNHLGDYGPTIILQHQIENQIFYTLYGHLSLDSINQLEIGSVFKKGQKLATLGDSAVNGDYAPHLHFQIIKNIENYWGDYPGVCSKNRLLFYLENCPDPNLLLKITFLK